MLLRTPHFAACQANGHIAVYIFIAYMLRHIDILRYAAISPHYVDAMLCHAIDLIADSAASRRCQRL